MLKTIAPDEVQLGMYVHAFKGNWISHPFWRSRFSVDRDDVLERLRASGIPIVIDTDKGRDVADRPEAIEPAPVPAAGRRAGVLARPVDPSPRPPQPTVFDPRSQRMGIVAPRTFGRADRTRAVALARRTTTAVKTLFDDCLQGRAIATPAVLEVVDDIAATLERNVNAFISVTRLKAKDDETYVHSVAVCALMISLARETGASADVLRAMGTAGLLHDIGKVSIDDRILKKTGELSATEMREVCRHPELGYAMLIDEVDLVPVARDVCLHHHERLDGSGYPFGLAGDQVSQATRIAAICDVYDMMTSDRPERKGLSPAAAIAELEAAGDAFDAALLFRLMRSINVFPAGKLVRLRSNRLAVVLPAKQPDRSAVARVFYSTIDACLLPYEDVVLGDALDTDQAIAPEMPDQWFADWPMMLERIIAGRPASVPAAASAG